MIKDNFGVEFSDDRKTLVRCPWDYKGEYVIPDSVENIEDCAFSDRNGLTSIVIPNSVKSIGKCAFNGCSGLTSLVIPNSVFKIGNGAFRNCNGLISIEIPLSIVNSISRYDSKSLFYGVQWEVSLERVLETYYGWIGLYIFSGCDNLTNVILSDNGVKYIKEKAFSGCNSITSVTIPSTITTIEDEAFANCFNLTSIVIPDSVTSVGKSVFKGCCNLSSIEISKHLEKIGEHAFEECKGLTSIVIPDSVTDIGSYAFYKCHNLTYVTIPNSVTELNAAFSGCSSLTSVNIPDNVNKIDGAFSGCSSLKSVRIPNSVKVIGADAFKGCSSLTAVDIPDGVERIEYYAFFSCSSLKSIVIPDGVKCIGFHAFKDCSSLTSVVIPDSVNEIESGAFENCSRLTSIILPSNLKIIKDYAFRGSGLSTITIPDSVTTISTQAFAECENLTSIIIPKGLKSIGSAAFSKCKKLASVRWDAKKCSCWEDLEKWDEYKTRYHTGPFIECPNLSSFVFGDSVQVIPEQLCEGLTSLTTLTIPENVISIEVNAFKGCTGLTSIIWNARYYSRGELTKQKEEFPRLFPIFDDSCNIRSFLFGSNVMEIPNRLCEGLENITEISIPDNVTKIGEEAFRECTGLKRLNIGQSISEIGKCAFWMCQNIESIVVSIDNPLYDSRNNSNAIIETISNTLVAGCQNTIIPDDVTNIGAEAFLGCRGIKSIKIPNSVTNIGVNAFFCSGIERPIFHRDIFAYMPLSFQGAYSIPDGIRHIVSCAFSYCSKLKTVIIPDSVSIIGSQAFYACKNLTSIILPSKLTEIEEATFSECVELKSVTLKEGITIIKRMAFYNCEALESISIPNSVTTIERGAFDNCYKLSKVILPRVLPHIDKYAFTNTYGALQISDCFGVTYTDNFQTIVSCPKDFRGKYNIYEGVANIGDKYSQPFDDCEGLTSIFIPNSLKKINLGSFRGCGGLTSIIVGNENTLYDSRNNCNAIIETATNKLIVGCQSTLIPNSVSTIGEKAFWRCNSLNSITIPDGVKNIEDYAFNECNNLSTVTFYESIQRIGYLAFINCENLKEISVPKGQKTRFLKIGLQKYADIIVERDNEEISTLTTVAKAYELGIGLPQNFTQAVLIYTQAAEKGGAEAAYKLAELYAQGEKLPYDRDKALTYYRQAAKSAFMDAASKVEVIQQQIKAEEARKAAALEAEKRRLLEEQKRKEEQQRKEQEEQLRKEQEERQRKEQEEQKRKELEERWRQEELRELAYYIFFDTETAGLPKRYRGFDVENWPRLVQLAWILTDKEGNIVNQKVAIIRPDGFTIPSDAAAIHGITTEIALREGEPIKVVLDEFIQDLKDAHWLVGHNIDFDKHIIGAEFDRLGIVNGKLRLGPSTCTMRASTDYCAIPDPNGQYKYRWPKLQELYQKLFGYKFDSAHDAMADVTATKDCFFELMRRGIINTRY